MTTELLQLICFDEITKVAHRKAFQKGHPLSRLLNLFLLGWLAEVVSIGWATDGLSFLVAVEENVTLIFNELALVVVVPESLEDGCIGVVVVLTDEGLEVLGGFRAVVERHFREELFVD